MRLLGLNRTAWMMSEDHAKHYTALYFDILRRRDLNIPHAVEPRGGVADIRNFTVSEGVAEITVRGPIVPHADMFSEVSGMASVEGIRSQIEMALESDDVNTILLNFDTPGGDVTGIADLARYIKSANDIKPVVGFVEGLCCSAGNYLMAGAGKRYISKTGEMGSIGVVMGWADASKLRESMGVEDVEFVSSVSPYKRAKHDTEDGKEYYQSLVDELGDIFVDDMADMYGVSREHVLKNFGQGRVVIGESAVKAGLADKVVSIDELKQSLSGNMNKTGLRAEGGQRMGSLEDVMVKLGWKKPDTQANTDIEPGEEGNKAPVQAVDTESQEKLKMLQEEAAKAKLELVQVKAAGIVSKLSERYADSDEFTALAGEVFADCLQGNVVAAEKIETLLSMPQETAVVVSTGVALVDESELENATRHENKDANKSAFDDIAKRVIYNK